MYLRSAVSVFGAEASEDVDAASVTGLAASVDVGAAAVVGGGIVVDCQATARHSPLRFMNVPVFKLFVTVFVPSALVVLPTSLNATTAALPYCWIRISSAV